MKKETALTLGEIFGVLIKLNPNWNTSAIQQNASVFPMRTVTELHKKALASGLLDKVEERIAELMNKLDVEDAATPMTEDNKGSFVIGQYKAG